MKKVNFNGVDNMTTPEEWLEQALAIPDTQITKGTATPLRVMWPLTAAACFIAFVTVSIILIFVFPYINTKCIIFT